jgi:hypothetical protein
VLRTSPPIGRAAARIGFVGRPPPGRPPPPATARHRPLAAARHRPLAAARHRPPPAACRQPPAACRRRRRPGRPKWPLTADKGPPGRAFVCHDMRRSARSCSRYETHTSAVVAPSHPQLWRLGEPAATEGLKRNYMEFAAGLSGDLLAALSGDDSAALPEDPAFLRRNPAGPNRRRRAGRGGYPLGAMTQPGRLRRHHAALAAHLGRRPSCGDYAVPCRLSQIRRTRSAEDDRSAAAHGTPAPGRRPPAAGRRAAEPPGWYAARAALSVAVACRQLIADIATTRRAHPGGEDVRTTGRLLAVQHHIQHSSANKRCPGATSTNQRPMSHIPSHSRRDPPQGHGHFTTACLAPTTHAIDRGEPGVCRLPGCGEYGVPWQPQLTRSTEASRASARLRRVWRALAATTHRTDRGGLSWRGRRRLTALALPPSAPTCSDLLRHSGNPCRPPGVACQDAPGAGKDRHQ